MLAVELVTVDSGQPVVQNMADPVRGLGGHAGGKEHGSARDEPGPGRAGQGMYWLLVV